jgi:hypothetical protein
MEEQEVPQPMIDPSTDNPKFIVEESVTHILTDFFDFCFKTGYQQKHNIDHERVIAEYIKFKTQN